MDGALMKKFFTIIFLICIFFSVNQSKADIIVPQASQSVDFSKSYKTSSENLLYLLLSALNENNYSIEEIQFKTGSVLFKVYTKEFIASIASQDRNNSFIKIIPADNNYNFSPTLIQKLHKYIEVNNGINYQKIL